MSSANHFFRQYVTIPLRKHDNFVSVNFYVTLGRQPAPGEKPDRYFPCPHEASSASKGMPLTS